MDKKEACNWFWIHYKGRSEPGKESIRVGVQLEAFRLFQVCLSEVKAEMGFLRGALDVEQFTELEAKIFELKDTVKKLRKAAEEPDWIEEEIPF